MPQIPTYSAQLSPRVVRTPVPSSAPEQMMAQATGNLGQALSGLANTAGSLIADYQEKQQRREATAFVSKQASDLQLSSLQTLQAMRTDGGDVNTYTDRFLEQYEKQADEILKSAPNPLAKEAMQDQVNSLRTSMVSKAITYQGQEKTALQKQAVQESLNAITNASFMDPENYDRYKGQIDEVLAASSGIFDPSEMQATRTSASQSLATTHVRALLERSPNVAEMALQKEDIRNNIPTSSFVALQDSISRAKEQRIRDALVMENKRADAFMKDPKTLAIMNGADPDDPNDILSKQYIERNGQIIKVPMNRRSLLSEDEASMVVDQLGGAVDADNLAFQLGTIREKYGENADVAFRDLNKAKLSDDIRYLTYMDPVADRQAFKALFNAQREGVKNVLEEAKTKATIGGDTSAFRVNIEGKIDEELEDMSQVLATENISTEEIKSMRDRAVNIAAYRYVKGDDPETAVAVGTSWLTSKYTIEKMNGRPFRIPSNRDSGAITDGLDEVLKGLGEGDLRLPVDTPKDIMLDYIKRTSSFVLDGSGNSYILIDGDGAPVVDKKGLGIRVSIDRAELLGRKNDSEAYKALMRLLEE